jgi:acyl-CoA thioesterase-1
MKIFIALLALSCLSTRAFPQNTLVCLGDSLTAGYGLDEDQAYPALLAKKLQGWKVLNAGVSGDTSAGGLKRLNWILKSRPQAVFVALGANDGLRGLRPADTEKNLEAILRRIQASGARPYLAGMMLPTNYGQKYRGDFAALYPQLAKRLSLPLMPFLLEGVGGVPSLNQADGIHPNADGARVVADHVWRFLKDRLPSPSPSGGAGPSAVPKVIRSKKDL